MKYSKVELTKASKQYYNSLIAMFGLKNALTIAKGITKLLKDEKKRRKDGM